MGKTVDTKKSIWGFGPKGWYIIIFCGLMFWFYAGISSDSTNILAPALSEKLGVDYPVVLSMGTIAGVIAVVLWILFGRVNMKLGVRKTSPICLILAGAAYICMGNAVNLAMFLVAWIVGAGCIMAAGAICGGVLVASWFPKKRGIVMGFTTIGLNCSGTFFVPLLAILTNAHGVEVATAVLGGICILLGVVGWLTIRNSPMERGQYPDNVSKEEYDKKYDTVDDVDDTTIWTARQLLKNKVMWQCAIPTGLIQMCTIGIVSQFVVRNMELGMEQMQAVGMMQAIAIIGIFCSWGYGVLDQKIGTARGMIVFCVITIIGLLLNVSETQAGIYISIVIIGSMIGGSANFLVSLPANVFGRHGFSTVNSVVMPIQGLLASLAFAINAFALATFGELRWAYLIYVVVCVVCIILTKFVPEFKYNRDIQAEVVPEAGAEEK